MYMEETDDGPSGQKSKMEEGFIRTVNSILNLYAGFCLKNL